MILEELRREAEVRAGSPEGISMLIDAVLRSLEEQLEAAIAAPEPSVDYELTLDALADMFGEIQRHNISVDEVRINPRAFDKLLNVQGISLHRETNRAELKKGILAYLWGASVIQDRTVPDGTFVLVSASGLPPFPLKKVFNLIPQRNDWLTDRFVTVLRSYVLAKRQRDILERRSRQEWVDGYDDKYSRFTNLIHEAGRNMKAIEERIGKPLADSLRKQHGPSMSFGTILGSNSTYCGALQA